MSPPTDSSRQPTSRPAKHVNGNGSGSASGGTPTGRQGRSVEQRRQPPPGSPDQYLDGLPASVLLSRLPVPMLAIGVDGIVVYNNPAFATMLGHGPDVTLTGYGLSALLDGHSSTSPGDCVITLREANNVLVNWLHAEGFPVRSVVSRTLFLQATEEVLLFGVTDITELIWNYPPE